MRILQAASEAFPFCKTGGLGDVIGALSRKLGEAGHDVALFLPKYRAVECSALRGARAYPLDIPLGSGRVRVRLRCLRRRSVSVWFIECPVLFDRDGLYGENGRDHPDNDVRFAVFSRAVLEGAKAVGFKADILHLHDWQTALGAVYLKTLYGRDPFFAGAASVLTVHNVAYQGAFPAKSFLNAGFARGDFEEARVAPGAGRGKKAAAKGPPSSQGGSSPLPEGAAAYSFLKAGLIHADWLTTVSPSYAREVCSPAGGLGMEAVLRRRRARLQGILNGLDLDCWSPERDSVLPRRYGLRDLAGKAVCKKKFLAECGLPADDGVALVGMIARFDRQKGWDIAVAAMAPRLGRCRFVAVGEGDPALVAAVSKWAARRSGAVHFRCGYDEDFAHRLYAAADILLMPSRFEPCGLGQMIAMRYGCVPVVTRTGGLADTVAEKGARPNGFMAEPRDPRDLGRALDRALAAYASPAWKGLMRAGMRSDFSWDRSVRRYLDLYGRAARAGPSGS